MGKSEDQSLALKAGIFVLLGLAVVAALVIQFGRLGEGFQSSYPIRVEFPDASGIYKGAEVLMSGARIGRVAASPQLIPDQSGVLIELSIQGKTKIAAGSRFMIGSSGLLGDKFVHVMPPPPDQHKEFLAPNATVKGEREASLDELTRDGKRVLEELKLATSSIRELIDKVNREILNDQNTSSIASTLKNIESGTRDIADFTKQLDAWGNGANTAIEDFAAASSSAKEFMQSGAALVNEARTGEGLFAAILRDRELSDNLKAFIANLKDRGVLFYSDRTKSDERSPADIGSRGRGRPGRQN